MSVTVLYRVSVSFSVSFSCRLFSRSLPLFSSLGRSLILCHCLCTCVILWVVLFSGSFSASFATSCLLVRYQKILQMSLYLSPGLAMRTKIKSKQYRLCLISQMQHTQSWNSTHLLSVSINTCFNTRISTVTPILSGYSYCISKRRSCCARPPEYVQAGRSASIPCMALSCCNDNYRTRYQCRGHWPECCIGIVLVRRQRVLVPLIRSDPQGGFWENEAWKLGKRDK